MSGKAKHSKVFNYKIYIGLIIILIIIIILLLLNACNNKKLIPTGNVDVFDLKCNSITCPKCNTCSVPQKSNDIGSTKKVSGNNGTSETSSIIEPNPEEEKEGFFAADNDKIWDISSDLRIFTYPAYVADGKIAPGVSNSYVFRVRNNNFFNVTYNMGFSEENLSNINIKYRLKKGDNYIKGDSNHWVSYSELNIDNVFLSLNTYDEYVLDWKWFEASNDTNIGIRANDSYKLTINIVGTEA